MMRTLAQSLIAVAVLLLLIADVQRVEAALEVAQARADVAARAAHADAVLGVRRPRHVHQPSEWGQ